MQGDRYDWLLVQIDEVAEAVRKLAAISTDTPRAEELDQLDEQTDGLLEDTFEHSQLRIVDARTAALILRPPARIRAYAQLLAAKAQLVHARGRLEASAQLVRRALELQLEAAALEPNPELVDHASIATLLAREPLPILGERHRGLLAALDSER